MRPGRNSSSAEKGALLRKCCLSCFADVISFPSPLPPPRPPGLFPPQLARKHLLLLLPLFVVEMVPACQALVGYGAPALDADQYSSCAGQKCPLHPAVGLIRDGGRAFLEHQEPLQDSGRALSICDNASTYHGAFYTMGIHRCWLK